MQVWSVVGVVFYTQQSVFTIMTCCQTLNFANIVHCYFYQTIQDKYKHQIQKQVVGCCRTVTVHAVRKRVATT